MMKRMLIKFHWFVSSQLGLDLLLLFRAIRGIPIFLRDFVSFRKEFRGKIVLMPCLHDRYEEGGVTKSEYFWQDLLVARAINAANPVKHVDIGSRVDGFVAHVASFREIEVFDVRPIRTTVPGVLFRQADLMNPASLPTTADGGYCDSLSCLHAIEHFGLGRYGDPVNPLGYQFGIDNMAHLLKKDGTFYLSTPVGQERVEFNANWVFDPRSIVNCALKNGLVLRDLIIINSSGHVSNKEITEQSLLEISNSNYQLGIFIFVKLY
jgi:hypothetical protein